MNLLVTISMCLCAVNIASAEKDKLEKICKDKAEVPIVDDLVKDGFKKGWYISMVKKADHAKKLLTNNIPEDKRKWNEKICYEGNANSPLGDLDTVGICKFNRTSYMTCVIVGTPTKTSAGNSAGGLGVTDLQGYGDTWVTKSDNQTYVVFVGCVTNKYPFWEVMSTVPELEESVQEEIFVHLEEMGFKREDASEKGKDVQGTYLKEKECGKDEGGTKKKKTVGKPPVAQTDVAGGLV